MRRSVQLFVLLPALSLGGCPKNQSAPRGDDSNSDNGVKVSEPGKKNMSSQEVVEKQEPGQTVNPWAEVNVSDLQFFFVANTIEFRGYAVVDGSDTALRGVAALKEAINRGAKTPVDIAWLTSFFLSKGERPVLNKSTDLAGVDASAAALVSPPRDDGGVVEFWIVEPTSAEPIRFRIDRSSLALERTVASEIAASGSDPIDAAVKALASGRAGQEVSLTVLAEACSDSRSAAALNDVVTSHPIAMIRQLAAFHLKKCNNAKTVDALISVLESDKHAPARQYAADALGEIKDAKARAALEAASKDPDPDVKGAATRSLAKPK